MGTPDFRRIQVTSGQDGQKTIVRKEPPPKFVFPKFCIKFIINQTFQGSQKRSRRIYGHRARRSGKERLGAY